MIDRIRYPDWAGKQVNPQGIFSCFCQELQERDAGSWNRCFRSYRGNECSGGTAKAAGI